MSDDIESLLAARASGADATNVDSLLNARAQGGMSPPPATSVAPVTTGRRFMQGATDLPVGLAQAAEHVAETPLNALRTVIRGSLNAVGAHDTAALFSPVSTGQFDDIVQQREQDYQNARQAAVAPTLTSLVTGQKEQPGIDWWRLAGAAANPINYAVPGGAAGTVLGRVGQAAAQGAAISAAQPSMTPGSFWYDKAKQSLVGGVTGAATAGLIETAIPVIIKGINAIRQAGAAPTSTSAAADATVNSALNAQGVDPKTVNLNVLAGLKQEAQNALEHGENPSPQMVALRAKAESLPYPMRLLKGQLMGNEPGGAIQFAKERNLRGIEGVGEPLTQAGVDLNAAAINNLDALGAKNALDPVELGGQLSSKVQSSWDALQAQKNAAYDAVRNSRGQSAMMDQFTAGRDIRGALDTPQASHAYDLLPSNIQKTIDDLEDGKLPLTVAQMQSLDKTWGAAARGADGSTAHAINTARSILNNAPISDELGEEARQAYAAARQMHAQQMSMVDEKLQNGMPNPNYQPIVDDVVYSGKAPETLFQKHFFGATPSAAGKNMEFVKALDPNLAPEVANTYMGEIKRLALSGASDQRGTISEKILSNHTQPIAAARMDAVLQDPVRTQIFRNLADVVEAAKRFPTESAVNTSGTSSAVINAATAALKAHGAERVSAAVGKIPIVGPLLNSKNISEGLKTSRLQTEVQKATTPGVTLKSLLSATPTQAANRRLAARLATPAAVGAVAASNEK